MGSWFLIIVKVYLYKSCRTFQDAQKSKITGLCYISWYGIAIWATGTIG